ncbi:MAG: hypothetical protein KDE20_26100, partial [Caldilineaceae bacterium]|nr:hypothetical protein [Caldilineaceae bacterium]
PSASEEPWTGGRNISFANADEPAGATMTIFAYPYDSTDYGDIYPRAERGQYGAIVMNPYDWKDNMQLSLLLGNGGVDREIGAEVTLRKTYQGTDLRLRGDDGLYMRSRYISLDADQIVLDAAKLLLLNFPTSAASVGIGFVYADASAGGTLKMRLA